LSTSWWLRHWRSGGRLTTRRGCSRCSIAPTLLSPRDAGRLVGIARAVTDFSYCCYLSDLAVDVAYQGRGIGKRLIEETHARAGKGTTLILVAAPAAKSYYPHIGMTHLAQCWSIPRAY